MIEKKDLWRHVFNAQMIKRGVLDELEALSRNEENEELEALDGWFSHDNKQSLLKISHSLVHRRGSAYKMAVDIILGDNAYLFERYIYDCLEKEIHPSQHIVEQFLTSKI